MQRRDFIRGAVSLSAFPYQLFAGTTKKSASDVIELGPRKVKVTRLAMGTGTNGMGGSSNQTRKLGMSGLADLLRTAYDNGVCFYDSADQYGTHPYVKEALKKVPREKVAILTKTHSSTYNEMKADLDRFRQELGADYIDIMLLHCMMDPDWPARKKGAMDFISEAQEKGLIKTKGRVPHPRRAEGRRQRPWVEVDLARINPAGAIMDADLATVTAVLKEMKAAGKGIIGMKIFGAGKLRHRVDECLQYALSTEIVDCFTIGSESVAELTDLTKRIPAASVRG